MKLFTPNLSISNTTKQKKVFFIVILSLFLSFIFNPSITQAVNNCTSAIPITGTGCTGSRIGSDTKNPLTDPSEYGSEIPQFALDFCNANNASCCFYAWTEVGQSGQFIGDVSAFTGVPTSGGPGSTIDCAVPTTGTVNVSSNIPGASWTITGPATLSGSGLSDSYTSKPTGTYTITWGTVNGFTPPSSSQTLTTGGTITFTGTYPSVSINISNVSTLDTILDFFIYKVFAYNK